MRKILFKAKAKNNSEWLEGDLHIMHFDICDKDDYKYGMQDRYFLSYYYACDTATSGFDDIEVVPETVCQFTGKPDKNGTKIFEHDILEFLNSDGGTSLYDVVWDPMDCSFSVKHLEANHAEDLLDDWFAERCEVIRNIFDNPELLEEGTE